MIDMLFYIFISQATKMEDNSKAEKQEEYKGEGTVQYREI